MRSKFTILAVLLLFANFISAQHDGHSTELNDFNLWFGLLEVPFLLFVVILSFVVANSLKGGKFGAGMSLLAWGFLVMAIGHIHMQIEHITDINLFRAALGNAGGKIAWFLALFLTWGLTAYGFIKIYKASRI